MTLFTAAYNPASDQIIGCQPGSLVWWHEAGHRASRKACLFALAIFPHVVTWCAVCLFYGLWRWAVVGFLIWDCLMFCLELFAWAYAFSHYNRKKAYKNISGRAKEKALCKRLI